eukprot:scaffold82068_cov75-Phaeocystis_antarctica.AAC.6
MRAEREEGDSTSRCASLEGSRLQAAARRRDGLVLHYAISMERRLLGQQLEPHSLAVVHGMMISEG